MSDRIRHYSGILFMLIAVLICVVPLLTASTEHETRFRSGNRQLRGIREIRTEQNGAVSVNTADADELTVLSGIGEKYAGQIIAERNERGPYYYAEDLQTVKGIGPVTLKRFRHMINLKTAESRE